KNARVLVGCARRRRRHSAIFVNACAPEVLRIVACALVPADSAMGWVGVTVLLSGKSSASADHKGVSAGHHPCGVAVGPIQPHIADVIEGAVLVGSAARILLVGL